MKLLHLAYCSENQSLADTVQRHLPDVVCQHHTEADGPIAEALSETADPVLLIVTDNFLKNEVCMSGIMGLVLSLIKHQRILAVIAPGVEWKDGVAVPVETHIDRVVYAIQYMNYWQQRYLAFSDRYTHAPDAEKVTLYPALQNLHSVADQMGEFISVLRDSEYLEWAYLEEARFVDVYTRLNIPVSHTPPPPALPVAPPSPPAAPVPPPPSAPETEWTEAAGMASGGAYHSEEIEHTIRDAWAWIEKGNKELGLEVFRLAMIQYPDHERLRMEYDLAIKEADAMAEEAEAENEAASYEAAGDSAFDDGDYLMAKYCWDRAAEADPQLPGIWRKLGLLTSDQLTGYRETSITYLTKALEQTPDDALLRERLRALTEEQDYTPSEPAVETAEEAAPPVFPPLSPMPTPVETAPTPVVSPTIARRTEIVCITGATSGIGKATAEEFARHGYRLILTGRRPERMQALVQHLQSAYGAEVLPLLFDIRDERAVANAMEGLPESWQSIDILINNAGLAKGLAPIHEGQLVHWETMIDTNIKGLLYITRLVSKGMVARRKGHIVNVGSSAGKEAYPNGNVYCATKFAVEALTRSMRFDLHSYGIRVSQVSPGHVEETEFALVRFDGDQEKAKIYNDFQPLKASDVAEAIWFIASRPPHVNIQDVWMFGTQQASATVVDRSGRS